MPNKYQRPPSAPSQMGLSPPTLGFSGQRHLGPKLQPKSSCQSGLSEDWVGMICPAKIHCPCVMGPHSHRLASLYTALGRSDSGGEGGHLE